MAPVSVPEKGDTPILGETTPNVQKQGTGNREQGTGNREQDGCSRVGDFGLPPLRSTTPRTRTCPRGSRQDATIGRGTFVGAVGFSIPCSLLPIPCFCGTRHTDTALLCQRQSSPWGGR